MNADERTKDFLEKTRRYFSEEEYKIIREGYVCIKPFVGEDMYSELASELETTVISKRDNNEEISFETVLKDVFKNLGIGKEGINTSIVRLRELNINDAAYDSNESTRRSAVSDVYEKLKCSKSLQNQIFLDVLSGINRNIIARKYRLTRADVDSIYTERLGFVKNILIVNDDILIEDVESRGPIQSNVKRLTDTNK